MGLQKIGLQAVFESDAFKKGMSDYKKSLGEANSSTEKAAHGMGQAFAGFQAQFLAAAVAIGAAVGAMKIAFDLGREGAQLEYAQGKFDRLATAIGTTSDALKSDLMVATKGTMSEMQAMTSAGDLMSLGLAKNHDQVVRLTAVSSALNMDMNQLVLTLSNMTTMRFDQLGVSVDGFKEKVKALEDAGMSAEQAFREAFLQQAEEQVRRVGNAADTSVGDFKRLDAAIRDFGDTIKLIFAGPMGDIAGSLADGLRSFADNRKAVDELAKAHQRGAISAKVYNDAVMALKYGQIESADATKLAVDAMEIQARDIMMWGSAKEQQIELLDRGIAGTLAGVDAASMISGATQDEADSYIALAQETIKLTEYKDLLKVAREQELISELEYQTALAKVKDNIFQYNEAEQGALRARIDANDTTALLKQNTEEYNVKVGESKARVLELAMAFKGLTSAQLATEAIKPLLEQLKSGEGDMTALYNAALDIGSEFGVLTPKSLAMATNFDKMSQAIAQGGLDADKAGEAWRLFYEDAADGEISVQGIVEKLGGVVDKTPEIEEGFSRVEEVMVGLGESTGGASGGASALDTTLFNMSTVTMPALSEQVRIMNEETLPSLVEGFASNQLLIQENSTTFGETVKLIWQGFMGGETGILAITKKVWELIFTEFQNAIGKLQGFATQIGNIISGIIKQIEEVIAKLGSLEAMQGGLGIKQGHWEKLSTGESVWVENRTGMDMTVPSGYANDKYPLPMITSSGERVIVLNKAQQRAVRNASAVSPSMGNGVTNNYYNDTNVNVDASYSQMQSPSTVARDLQIMSMLGVI